MRKFTILACCTILLIIQWCQKSPTGQRDLLEIKARQGDAHAQVSLAAIYETGRGVPKDETKAVEWYQKAAFQGDPIEVKKGSVLYIDSSHLFLLTNLHAKTGAR